VRLFTLRVTEKQMQLMLDHVDSPYIRCIGFLYLRYASDPAGLWTWVEPYVYDDEVVKIQQRPNSGGVGGRYIRGGGRGGSGQDHEQMTVGKYVRQLLETNQYHGTLLPRLPVTIEREIKVKLLQAEKIEERAKKHFKNSRSMDYFRKLGSNIKALYGDDENPVTWYDAIVDRVITKHEETGADLPRPKFVVTFPQYGNTETVTLGEIDFRDADHHGSGSSSGGGRYDHRDGGSHSYDRGSRGDHHDHYKNSRGYSGRGDDHRSSSRGYARGDDRGRDRWDDDRDRHYNRGRDNHHHGGRARSRSRERDGDGGTRGASRGVAGSSELDERSLMDEVLRREREKSTASGKAYAARPPTCKTSLAVDSHDARDGDRQNKRSYDYGTARDQSNSSRNTSTSFPQNASSSSSQPSQSQTATRKKTPEELAAIEDRKRKLRAKYG